MDALSRHPRNHWLVLVLCAIAVFGALVLQGFGEGTKKRTQPGNVPPMAAEQAGPVLDTSAAQARGARVPSRTVALTFTGGPDPRWTPRMLDILRRHGARATFFVVGTQVARRSDLVRRIVREGDELGSGTYTYSDLGAESPWREHLELDLTQHALAGVAGVHSRLVRMPHVSSANALYGDRWRAAREIGRRGNLLVLADRDSRQATRATPNAIAAAVTPTGTQGAVVALPDTGGDEAITAKALDLLLTRLDQRDYRVTTVTDALGIAPATVRASTGARAVGLALVYAQRAATWTTYVLAVLFSLAAVFTTGRVLFLLVFARLHIFRLWRERRRKRRRQLAYTRKNRWATAFGADPPPVSVIVPAHNEEANIAATVRSLVDTLYDGEVQVVVVDDGSTDWTADTVEELGLPEVSVIRRPNGGKSAALNTGIAAAHHEILILVDGDTVFVPSTIPRLIEPLSNSAVGAVSGNTKVANRRSLLGRWQHVEYVIGFNLDRRMYDLLRCMPTVPGAIGAFRRRAIERVGGLTNDTLAEDTDLTMALCRAGWRVVYQETAIALTEAPSSLRQLWRQRCRWSYGTMQAMWKHRRALIERGPSGRFGRRALPYLTLYQIVLPLCAPSVDLLALYTIFIVNPWKVALAWLAFSFTQVIAARSALWLDGESTRPIWTLPLQQLIYRQFMYLVIIQSLVSAILGVRLRWQVLQRTGAVSAGPSTVI